MSQMGLIGKMIKAGLPGAVNRITEEIIFRYMRWMFAAACMLMVALMIAFPYAQSRKPSNNTDLSGSWKISLEDNPLFASPHYDDKNWDTVTLPGSFMGYAEKNNRYEGVCWLRKKVVFGPGLTEGDLGVCLGRIGNADETFVNGVKVGGLGGFPPDEFAMWNHPRNYRVSRRDIVTDGENLIAIRVSYLGLGEVLGNMFVTDEKNYKKYSVASTFAQVGMGYVAIAMGTALLIIFLFFYLKRIEHHEYLYYCLQLCFGLPVVLALCNHWPVFGDPHSNFIIVGLSWVALNVAHPIFLHRIYRLERPNIEKMLWCYFFLTTALAFFFCERSNIRALGMILIVITTGIGFYNFSCNITAVLKKSPYSKIFAFFGITVVSCAIHDGFVYMNKFSNCNIHFFGYIPSMMIFHVGVIFLYTGTALVLVARFINVADEVAGLNETLENFIVENAMLNERLEKILKKKPETAMSTIAEEKIKNVIKYINDHYLTEISREDLAGSVGVHPDSLGKQFKKFTGYKLGDYINELRVNEAARRLREEDTNIIDIAFDVGFESVRTFNRIFPKFMNETPNNYRKIYHGGTADSENND